MAEEEEKVFVRMVSSQSMINVSPIRRLEIELESILNRLERSEIELDPKLASRLIALGHNHCEEACPEGDEERVVDEDVCFYLEPIPKEEARLRNGGKRPKCKQLAKHPPEPRRGMSLESRLEAAPQKLKHCIEAWHEIDREGAFDIRFYYEHLRTGFEDAKHLELSGGDTVAAGKYKIKSPLGRGAFSKTYAAKCENTYVCLKVITNDKDFFDQSLDEIKLLRYLNACGDVDEHCIIKYFDAFYTREHLFLVTELLQGGNLHQYARSLAKPPPHTTIANIASDCLKALSYIHALNIFHCDIKPENILVQKTSTQMKAKLIDFGSSSFSSDNAGLYIQSRSYRAPEVILGAPYNTQIDLWSLGCVLFEFRTAGIVLFKNYSIPNILASMVSVLGDFPTRLLSQARFKDDFFLRDTNEIFDFRTILREPNITSTKKQSKDQKPASSCSNSAAHTVDSPSALFTENPHDHVRITVDLDSPSSSSSSFSERNSVRTERTCVLIRSKPSSLAARLGALHHPHIAEDNRFISLLMSLLNLDSQLRASADKAQRHPYILSTSTNTNANSNRQEQHPAQETAAAAPAPGRKKLSVLSSLMNNAKYHVL